MDEIGSDELEAKVEARFAAQKAKPSFGTVAMPDLRVSYSFGMVNIDSDEIRYTALRNIYKDGWGDGLQVAEGIDWSHTLKLCRVIADAVIEYHQAYG